VDLSLNLPLFDLSLFITCLAFIAVYLTYVYVRDKHVHYQKMHFVYEEKLKERESTELQLKQEIQSLEEKLQHTFEDPVTHLLSWKLFEDRLTQNIRDSGRYHFHLAVLSVDIDDFKSINRALGYEVGNALLREVGARLLSCIRQVDSATRFANDTFVVLLAQLTNAETAVIATQRILQCLAEPFHLNEHELYITAHVGIAMYPIDGEEATVLVRSAEHALHFAKTQGKHIYQFCQEGLHHQSERVLALHTHLNHDAVFNEFLLYFQPIVDTKHETILCLDALPYWQHPQLGLIAPQELLSQAEKQRKLNLVSEWLFTQAIKQFMHWRTLGFNPAFLGISVHFTQLENSHFVYRLSHILQSSQCKPEWILLEITGNFTQASKETLVKTFNMLKYLGVNIAIDDFGTGSFSLWQLKNFPAQYIRLNSELIEDVDTHLQTAELVKSMLTLASGMGIQVIVQGVESDPQAAKLKELGCFLQQGQLLGAPLPQDEIASQMAVPAAE